jgi:hypothetical protein
LVSSSPALLLVPALVTVAILALPDAMQPPPQLVVWSEGESGAQVARYQAWQLFPGFARGHARVALAPQLASARPCEPSQPMRFEFDAKQGRSTFADFDTRLFRQIALCYSGMLPLSRAIAIEGRSDDLLNVRNPGRTAWPSGMLLAGGRVHEMPTLLPGGSTKVPAEAGAPPRDTLSRTAMARTQADRPAALWRLDSSDVADGASESKAWLLLTAERQ